LSEAYKSFTLKDIALPVFTPAISGHSMVASIPNGTLRNRFNRAGAISEFRPGVGAEAPLSKFAALRQRAGPNRPLMGALLESGSLPLFLSLVSPPAPYQLNTV
jgi:hypothetical protein